MAEQRRALQLCCSSCSVLWVGLLMPLSCSLVSANCSQGGNATSMQSLPIILSSSFPHKFAFLWIDCFSFRVSLFEFFLSSCQLSIPWIPHVLSGSVTLLWHPTFILSLPLPCSSLNMTPLLPYFLSFSPKPFPSQFHQLYPSCLPRAPHFSLLQHMHKDTAKDEPEDQDYWEYENENTCQSHSGKKTGDWGEIEN